MPSVTDPYVAKIMFTGRMGPHTKGVLSVGISPGSLCICRGSAFIHHPILDVHGTKGGRSSVGRCVIFYLPVVSTNRVMVFVSTTLIAHSGRAQAEELFEKWIRAMLVTEYCSHMPFEMWNKVICSASSYHSDSG
jgi:hypothetical protein